MKNIWLLTLALPLLYTAPEAYAAARQAPDMKAADLFMKKAFGMTCQRNEPDPDWDKRYDIKFKYRYEDAATPDHVFHLYKMHCDLGAYNETSVFLTRDEDGNFQIIPFAEIKATYDYENDTETKLKRPPVVTGITSTVTLVNADYDPETRTITSNDKWRGLGDAFDSGTYEFEEGEFVLKSFVVDPLYDMNLDGSDPPELPDQTIVLFPIGKASNP